MGLVYRARDGGGGEFALKLIRSNLLSDERFRRRFEREARAASQLRHPNVVAISDQGEHGGVPYIVQEFISGGSLDDVLEERGQLSVPETVRICADAAAGLEAVHALEITHRDIKPGNIMLDAEGVAHINDFGLAKQRDASVLTRPGQAVGSLDYMAPEQIRGEEIGPATDVYSLGCVVHECLTGSPPFGDRKGMQALWAHLQDPPPNPAATRSDLGDELSWTMLKALEKDPANRPQTPVIYARMLRVAAGDTR